MRTVNSKSVFCRPGDNKLEEVTVLFSREQWNKITQYAKDNDMTVDSFIQTCVNVTIQRIQRNRQKEPPCEP